MHDEDQSNNISLDADGQPVKEEKLDATPEDDSAPNDINTKSSEEKKHRRELSSQDLCEASSQVEKSQSHKKREAENIVQDVSDFTATSTPEKNHMVEISMTARHENLIQKYCVGASILWNSIKRPQSLRPSIKLARKKQKRARDICKLFEKIGFDKINGEYKLKNHVRISSFTFSRLTKIIYKTKQKTVN
ncbi:unnamed protein product [Rhizophagus irregularis]|uniref:Uncharacterized protein n=1 Tax=Rhizophagus irregularis TaxID=588596 RepID=A0A916EA04_9GLOM|nr:unnamed protein product [Rhizophagus irregularis]